MAQRTITQLVDDITGKEINDGQGETITFSVNSGQYSIDLDAKNAKKFYDTVAFYQDHATKIGRTGRAVRAGQASGASRTRRRTSGDVDPATVRVWAAENGIEVSPRGRISAQVIEQYQAAGN